MGGLHHCVRVLVHVDIFPRGAFLRKYGSTAMHIDFLIVACGIFMDGLTVFMMLFFFGDVSESFLMLLVFGVGIGDEIGFESVGGKYFFV